MSKKIFVLDTNVLIHNPQAMFSFENNRVVIPITVIEEVDNFKKGLEEDSWGIIYSDYIPEKEKTRETLLTVGNGYFGTRGAFEETDANEFNYPGTYIAGVYNRLVSKVGDRDIENEDFVNCPNWLPIKFNIGSDDQMDLNKAEVLDIERKLDFKTGLFIKKLIVRDKDGKQISGPGQRISKAKACWMPGSVVAKEKILKVGKFGILHKKED